MWFNFCGAFSLWLVSAQPALTPALFPFITDVVAIICSQEPSPTRKTWRCGAASSRWHVRCSSVGGHIRQRDVHSRSTIGGEERAEHEPSGNEALRSEIEGVD